MRRLFVLLAGLVLVLALVGCNSQETESTTPVEEGATTETTETTETMETTETTEITETTETTESTETTEDVGGEEAIE